MADREPEAEQEPDAVQEPDAELAGLPRRTTGRRAPQTDTETQQMARRIVELASDKKAADIVLLDIHELTTLADFFVICSGQSERQLGAIADGIVEGMREEGIRPIGREGTANAHWLLLDFGGVIAHVMAPPERDFYQLEKLWSEAPLLMRLQ